MTEHVTEWIGAYHDRELGGELLQVVERHLDECPACQAELDSARQLSSLLQSASLEAKFLPTDRFLAGLALRLPPLPAEPLHRRMLRIGWWLVPVGLLGAWLFVEITLGLTSALSLAADAGLLDGSLSLAPDQPYAMSWFAAALSLFGSRLGAPVWGLLSALNEIHLFVSQLASSLVPQLLFAALYLGWLVAWWLRRQNLSLLSGRSESQSA